MTFSRLIDSLRKPPRPALLFGILVGIASVVYYLTLSGLQIHDFKVYYFAAERSLAGRPFVGELEGPNGDVLQFVYPPVVVLLFYPYTVFPSWAHAFVLHNLANIAVALYISRLVVRYLHQHLTEPLSRVDELLIYGVFLLSPYPVMTIAQGQMNLLLLLCFVVGYLWLEQSRPTLSGVAFGLAALVKLFPALMGVWLLRHRSIRGVASAIAIGVGGLVAGVLLFGPETSIDAFEYILTERSRMSAVESGIGPHNHQTTLLRPISNLLPGLGGTAQVLLSAALLSIPLAILYRSMDDRPGRLYGFAGTILFMTLIFPSGMTYQLFLLFPVVLLCYLVDDRGEELLLTAGLGFIFLPFVPEHILPVASLVLPQGARGVFESVLLRAFTFGSFPLLGDCLILAAGLKHQGGPTRAILSYSKRGLGGDSDKF